MKTTNKNGNDFLVSGEAKEAKCGPNAKKMMVILVPFFATIWFLFSIVLAHYGLPTQGFNLGGVRARVFGLQHPMHEPQEIYTQDFPETKSDKLLGGLLTPGFDEKSCLSRYNSRLYRKRSSYSPSSPLISKLRAYEALHKRCSPGTESYRKALDHLNSGKQSGPLDCNYVVWISYNGLGNRILTLTSAFLYALLTNRVLLVDRGKDMADLFCEPFPEASWLLPTDFPLVSEIHESNQKSNLTYGNMLKRNAFGKTNNTTIPSSLFLYMGHMYDDQDKLFFCDQEQNFFRKVPWLMIIKTNMYFLPSLFLIPSFEQDLSNLFPQKETVFHFLGRYLFHPTNQVWGLITRFYEAYLENSHEKIGVQIRLFQANSGSLQYVFDQILSCLVSEKILPEITQQEPTLGRIEKCKTKAVIITSLYSSYYEKLRDTYWENPTTTGEVIKFYQPSHEKVEQNYKKTHNMKAWAEIYLLSLSDKLVTSTMSTFGYVAQGLGGLRPWILYNPKNQTAPDPPCHRGISFEPCFQWPQYNDCKKRTWVDTGKMVPHVRHCEDFSRGLKLVDVET